MQWAYETYERNAHLAGVPVAEQEPLTPVSHIIQNAQIEITLGTDGTFMSARRIPKEDNKTIIPVTEASASRTSASAAHPLCDNLQYLAPGDEGKHGDYLEQLTRWADSGFTHPKVQAVLAYIQSGCILDDLSHAGVIELDDQGRPSGGRIEGTEYAKCLVRWRIEPPPEGVSSACWEDQSLFDSFAAYYRDQQAQEQALCLVTGRLDAVAANHPKGVVLSNFGAKLVSANDNTWFTYRGRFSDVQQAGSVGYTASQKAHSALRWLAANQGVILGGRTFLCWCPEGKSVPQYGFLGFAPEEPAPDADSYRRELRRTLSGYGQALTDIDHVVLAALDAATTGRLSITYYNVLQGSDFLDRIQSWYGSCLWHYGRGKSTAVYSPTPRQIVSCAFGTQQGAFIQADDRLMKEHVQRLFQCIADRAPIPVDIVRALGARASIPLAYSGDNREFLLFTACAVIRKYHNDKSNGEEWTMALDTGNTDRSYLFGRLLAVAEHVERSTYGKEEKREPNAIRLQSVFCQRPMYAWGLIDKALNPYYAKLAPGLRWYYKDIVSEIVDKLPAADDPSLDQPLEDVYLLGYYLQRHDLTHSHKDDPTDHEMEETTDECTD